MTLSDVALFGYGIVCIVGGLWMAWEGLWR